MSKFTDWLAKSGSADPWKTGKHGKQHKSKGEPRLVEFDVTFDVLEDVDNPAPRELDAQLPGLVELMYEGPAKALPKVEALLERFPNECHLLNLLANALSATGQKERAMEVTERNYRLHPSYLFARMNYAEILVVTGRLDAVPAVFGGHFNLKRLYPHRNLFHVTEVVGFYSVLGRYQAAAGDLEAAENCLGLLKDLDPDHPATKALEKSLARASLTNAMFKLKKMVWGRSSDAPRDAPPDAPSGAAPGGALPGPRRPHRDRRRDKKRKRR